MTATGIASFLRNHLQNEQDYNIKNTQIFDGSLYIEWVPSRSEPEEIFEGSNFMVLVCAFPLTMDNFGWPSEIHNLVLQIYDPADEVNEHEDAYRLQVSTELAREHSRGELTEEELVAEALDTLHIINSDGSIEDVDVDSTIV